MNQILNWKKRKFLIKIKLISKNMIIEKIIFKRVRIKSNVKFLKYNFIISKILI